MELIAGAESLWVQNVVAENLVTHENNSLYGNLKLLVGFQLCSAQHGPLQLKTDQQVILWAHYAPTLLAYFSYWKDYKRLYTL